jgi:hypothetical protein
MLKKSFSLAFPLFVFLISFVATSCAAGVVTPDGDALSLIRPVWDAFAHGRYYYAGALALVAAVALARIYGGDLVPWFRGDQGGAALALLGALGASLSTALADGQVLSWSIVEHAVVIAISAAGGYTLIKRLIVVPYLLPLGERYPKLRPALDLLLWVFGPQPKD